MTGDQVRAAARRIGPFIRCTPVFRVVIDGRPVTLKLEHLQLTGSFKIRGALNALLTGPATERVITASGGNHGLGVAAAARLLGITATVFVPENVPPAKERRIVAAGAEVIREGVRYADAEQAARRLAGRAGARYLHAYDDAAVIAGQGTVGLEVAAQAAECDTVAVAVGGGGLIAGVSVAAGRTVVGVEPEGCQALHAAVAAGRPADVPIDSVAASALGATQVGAAPFAVLQDAVLRAAASRGRAPEPAGRPAAALRLALVSDAEMMAARDRLWEEFRLAVEPAAAAVLAAWLAGRVPGEHPCLVLCGANDDWTPGQVTDEMPGQATDE
jgi:threonine dehydratase